MNDDPKRIPDYLCGHPFGPPPRNAETSYRLGWLRQFIRSFAEYHAMLVVAGEMEDVGAICEVGLAAGGACRDLDWALDIAGAATQAEWTRALDTARSVTDGVLKAVTWPIRRHEPGAEVLAAAKRADPQAILPTDVLIDICAKVARAGARGRVRN